MHEVELISYSGFIQLNVYLHTYIPICIPCIPYYNSAYFGMISPLVYRLDFSVPIGIFYPDQKWGFN